MSIIHDALKKVEPAVAAQAAARGKAPAPAKKRSTLPSLLITGCLILLLALAGAAFKPKKPGAKKAARPARWNVQDGHVLTGVFNSGDEAYAILNDKIVKVGDTVDGVVVKEIGEDELLIEEGGTTRRLSTRLK